MKRMIIIWLEVCMVIALLPASVFAAEKTSSITDGYYYIQHIDSSKYLEIDPDYSEVEEEPLRIWSKNSMQQTQVFRLMNTTKGWIIYTYPSGKVLEVEDESTKNYASIVQTDDEGRTSQRWTLIYNTDGTVSFQNRKSDKYMNISETKNGSEVFQYNSNPDKYNMYILDGSDVVTGKWVRELKESEITWSTDGGRYSDVMNNTGWSHSNSTYYPKPGNTYFMGVECIEPEVVEEIINARQKLPQYWEEIKEAIEGKLSISEISELLEDMGFNNNAYEYLDNGIGILKVLWYNRDNTEWSKFLTAASQDKYGNCEGIIVYNFATITERGESTSSGWKKVVEVVEQCEYYTWNKTNFNNANEKVKNLNGGWRYLFK